MTRTPAIAGILLDRLLGPDDPLIGDLLEEFHGGRSRLWLWRQLALLAVATVARDFRHYILRVIVAVIVGAVAIMTARGIADSTMAAIARAWFGTFLIQSSL